MDWIMQKNLDIIMSSKETLNHNIKRKRQLRKINHPAMAKDWDDIDREERQRRLRNWKININLKKNDGEVR